MKIYCPKCRSIIDTDLDPESVGNEPEFAFCRNESCLEVINLKYDKYPVVDENSSSQLALIPPQPATPVKEFIPLGHCQRCGTNLGLLNKLRGRELCNACQKICDLEAEAERRDYLADLRDGKLPILDVPLILAPDETCHFTVDSKLYSEVIKRRGRVGGFSIRVMKGVYWHTGGFASEPESHVQEVDSGKIYITNKKTYFIGGLKTITIAHKKVLNYVRYQDGFKLNYEGSKKPFIFGIADVDTAIAVLEGVLKPV